MKPLNLSPCWQLTPLHPCPQIHTALSQMPPLLHGGLHATGATAGGSVHDNAEVKRTLTVDFARN